MVAGRKHSKNLWPVSWRQEYPHWVSFVQVELTWFKRNKPLAISKVTQSLLLCKLFGNGEVGWWLVLHFWCKTTAHKVLDVQATCWNVNHKIGIRLSIARFSSRPYQLVIAGFLPSTAFQHLYKVLALKNYHLQLVSQVPEIKKKIWPDCHHLKQNMASYCWWLKSCTSW